MSRSLAFALLAAALAPLLTGADPSPRRLSREALRDKIKGAWAGPGVHDNDLWRVYELAPGEHILRLVTRADADPQSKGKAIGLRHAAIYAPAAATPGGPRR